MQTRRDQLQAYRYLVRRVLTAMLGHNPESLEQPMRRVGAATLSGILVAVLAVAGAGIYGKYRGGSASAWQKAGVLIIERGTGSRFVWDADHQELLPVRNYTSARLLLRSAEFDTVTVSPKSLAGARRGAPVGIPDAPDSLPAADHVVSAPWTVCVRHRQQSSERPVSTLVIGPREGGRPLHDAALVVRAADAAAGAGHGLYLIWHGRRLATGTDALRSLGLDRQTPLAVSAAWINALPPGPDLQPMAIAHAGRATSARLAGAQVEVGDVIRSTGAGGYYVMLTDGLAPISRTQALLLLGQPGRAQTEPTKASAAAVNAVPASPTSLARTGLPASPPDLADPTPTSPLCVRTVDADGRVDDSPQVSVGGSTGTPAATAGAGSAPGGTVDHVSIEPGTVAIVSRLQANGKAAPGAYLITDAGLRYPVPAVSVLDMLGYPTKAGADDAVEVLPIPGRILDLLASGPALDPAETPSMKATTTP